MFFFFFFSSNPYVTVLKLELSGSVCITAKALGAISTLVFNTQSRPVFEVEPNASDRD